MYNSDRSLPPTHVSVRRARGVNLLNISWTATTKIGVNQTYITVFDAEYTINTTYPHYIINQEIAVNGAGKSDPSKNVSIPSLPDIGQSQPLSHIKYGNMMERSE